MIEFVALIACNLITLDFSIRGFRRSKLRAFPFFIAAACLDLVLNFAWYIRSVSAPLNAAETITYRFMHTGGVIAASALWTAAIVTLVRHLLAAENRNKGLRDGD